MNAYEAKQAAKKQRYLDLAGKNDDKSNALYEESRGAVSGIPFGQPILVGHHSESRHRSAIKRSHDKMGKSVEASNKAKYYERKAASVGKGGISSDDPDALKKLKEKLAEAEKFHDEMVLMNAAWRAYKKAPEAKTTIAKLSHFSEETQNKIKNFVPEYSWEKGPIASYLLQNSNGSKGQIKKRISELEAKAAYIPEEDKVFDGFKLVENTEINRIQFLFDGKPDEETRKILKASAFRWAPSESAWQRPLNNGSKYAAEQVIKKLNK